MNKRDQLLADTLGPVPGDALPRAAAALVRRRRALRQACAATGGAAVLAVLLAFVAPRPHPAATTVSRPDASVGPAPIEIISDQELVALLADQPVLLHKEGGRISRVTLLEQPPGAAP